MRGKDPGRVGYESEGDTYDVKEKTAIYSFLRHPVDVESGKTYELEIRSDAPENCGLGLYCVTAGRGNELLTSSREEGMPEKSSLQMCVTGVQ